jgi:adenylate cyclase
MDEVTKNPGPSAEAIRAELARILEHPEFHATKRMRDFLRFVVEQTLAGNARKLKGFTIATEVFGRDENFDAALDPVVRIQAGRLRRAIERYYLIAGVQDPIHIDIPKGSYVPVFSASPEPAARQRDAEAAGPISWPRILVLPFEDLAGDPEFAYFGPGLATELCIGLGHCPELRVMLSNELVPTVSEAASRPDFVVRGSVQRHGNEIKVMVQLVDAGSGEQLWVDSLKMTPHDDSLISFQENAASAITAHIAGSHGAIFRALTRKPGQSPASEMTCYQAILKGHAYHLKVDADSYRQALEGLTEAHRNDPGCGLACTLLAMLYVDNLSMEFFDVRETPLDEAVRLARDGVRLEPNHQLSRIMLARVHHLAGNLEAGLAEAEKALALHPEALLFMDVIGYMLALLGEWQRGVDVIHRAIRLNPYYRVFVRYATWLNAFRLGDYETALAESERLVGVAYFWDPLSRAATLGALGRKAESRAAIAELLAIKPDFPQRGHILIGRYVKFTELQQRIVEGLEAGGLVLEAETPSSGRSGL